MVNAATRRHKLAGTLIAVLAVTPFALVGAGAAGAAGTATPPTGGAVPGTAVHTITKLDTSQLGHGAVGSMLSAADRAKVLTHTVIAKTADAKVVETKAFAPGGASSVATATFDVTYFGSDFALAQETAFQAAVDTWARVLSAPRAITVQTDFEPLGDYILGGTNVPNQYYGLPGLKPGVLYPRALAKQLATTTNFSPSIPDISIAFTNRITPASLGVTWYFGTDGLTPPDGVDFETTSLHELGHGLGFFATLDADDPGTGGCALGRGCYGFDGYFGALLPGIFDTDVAACPNNHFLTPGATGSGQSAHYGNKSTALHAALTSNNICWTGAGGVAGDNGLRPKLYAPSAWEAGSSGSHLDQNTYNPRDNPNALMDPKLTAGTAIHAPGPIVVGMLGDIGWSTDAPSAPNSVHVSPTNGGATVTWSAPSSAGTSAITSYVATAYRLGVPARSAVVGGTGATITGLSNGSAYTVRVAAVNATGAGTPSGSVGVTPTPISNYYASHGGSGGAFGALVTAESAASGGFIAIYANGAIAYSAATGVHGISGVFWTRFDAGGRTHFIGLPNSEVVATRGGRGTVQNFTGGAIYTSSLGTFAIRHINAHYVGLGADHGFLGLPTSDEAPHGGGGNLATFQGGRMYYTVAYGAHEVHGAILTEWGNLGGSAGGLGYPTTDVRTTAGNSAGRYTQFKSGYIFWSSATGAHRVTGAILLYFLSRSGAGGRYGLPKGNPIRVDSVHVRQTFVHGSITTNITTEAVNGTLG